MKIAGLFSLSLLLCPLACGGGSSMPTMMKPPLPAPAFDWAGVIGTGQSLSVGAQGTPENATQPVYNNLKLSLGTLYVPPIPDPTDPTVQAALSMVPLVEPIRPHSTGTLEWPLNIFGETPHTAMANEVTALYRAAAGADAGAADYITVHTVVGESGEPMTEIEKGATDTGAKGRAYAASLFEAQAISGQAATAGKTYGVGAVVITHGEADAGNTDYGNELYQMWSDYNADLAVITGQTRSIPLLVSQQDSVPTGLGMGSASTLAQWQVGVDHPGDVICTGPKYQYPYYTDGVHLTATGYDMLGEKYGEVFFHAVALGDGWQPLQPVSADASGNVINVHFHVPVGPLAWDDSNVVAPQGLQPEWANGRGFEVQLASAPELIESVQIVGDMMDTVQITCADTVEGQNVGVAYAYTAATGLTQTLTSDGFTYRNGTVRWGQLMDSDPLVGSTSGIAQPNYAVSFYIPVPYAAPATP
jgi:hypothetical protein